MTAHLRQICEYFMRHTFVTFSMPSLEYFLNILIRHLVFGLVLILKYVSEDLASKLFQKKLESNKASSFNHSVFSDVHGTSIPHSHEFLSTWKGIHAYPMRE